MKRKLIVVLILILIFIASLLTYTGWNGENKKVLSLEATGMIEALEVDVSPKILERIEWLCCREGDNVRRGRTVLRLDKSEIQAKLDETKAVLRGAEAGYNVSVANYENAGARIERANAEIKAAEYEIERAMAIFEEAGDNYNRILELYKQGYASKRDMDTVKSVYNTTNAQLNSALAKKNSSEADLSSAKANIKASDAQVTSAKVNIKQAEARVRLAEVQLKDTEISSPLDGLIAYKYYEEGEITSPGKAVYTIYDMSNLWARIDIEETDIGKIRLGEKAFITTGVFGDNNFEGEVIDINREADFATQRDVTRGRQDIKTFRVKVLINNNDGVLKPGMTVKVTFNLGSSKQ